MDNESLPRLQELHPLVRESAILAYNEAVKQTPKNIHPYVLETYRSFARSEALYAQGRTKPGPIVTNAKAGQSYHNYRLALDFALQVKGKIVWNVDENWITVVSIFKSHGWEWGGDFSGSFRDFPHLEKRMGYHWKELLKLYNAGKVDSKGNVII